MYYIFFHSVNVFNVPKNNNKFAANKITLNRVNGEGKKLRGHQKIPHRLFVEVIITSLCWKSDCGVVWNHKPGTDPDQICLYTVLRGLKTNSTTYFYQYLANIDKNITMSYQHVRKHDWHFPAWSEFISSHIFWMVSLMMSHLLFSYRVIYEIYECGTHII